MEKGTLFYTEWPDGSAEFGYEDFDVDCFGGGDYEVIYNLDAENRAKMEGMLSEEFDGNLKEKILAKFGVHLDQESLYGWMTEHGITFRLFTWVS